MHPHPRTAHLPRALALLLVLFVTLPALLVAAPAHAASEAVKKLDATFAIQPDGSVRVRYQLDWRFPNADRHGIKFGIATRESWDADPSQDAVYTVSDIAVSSPSGAPAQVTQARSASGSTETLTLTVGDPKQTVGSTDATYVVSYTLRGALRTFDGTPEFFWDVTSPSYPTIEQYAVRVTAPHGVTRARCLAGTTECTAAVTGGAAEYSGAKPSGVLSVVAGLPAGSVANASPSLAPRRITSPEVEQISGSTVVDAAGVARVRETLTYRNPEDGRPASFPLFITERLPWSPQQDQVFTVSDVRVTDAAGRPLTTTREAPDPDRSRQLARYVVQQDASAELSSTYRVEYTLRGGVVVQGDTAHVRLPLASDALPAVRRPDLSWTLPAPITSATCEDATSAEAPNVCDAWPVSGSTVAMTGTARNRYLSTVHLTLPAAAFPGVPSPLETSIEATRAQRTQTAQIGGGIAAVVLAASGFVVSGLTRRKDRRYAAVAPGLTDAPGAPTRPASPKEDVPVRFSPPDLRVEDAGLLLDRGFRPTHLAAALVALAVRGQIKLASKPVSVVRSGPQAGETDVERTILEHATNREEELDATSARAMRAAVEEHQQKVLDNGPWFPDPANRAARTMVWVLAILAVGLVAALALVVGWTWLFQASPLRSASGWLVAGVIVGAVLALVLGFLRGHPPTLTAEGTALLDQVRGFRTYLATAEAPQLDFEAGRDIYRRYLPWAVLFGLTERWTTICRRWAADGLIDEPDTAFWIGSLGGDFDRELSSLSSEVGSASAPPASSGGSGGSSGFSDSSFGGGGGGGTSASSW